METLADNTVTTRIPPQLIRSDTKGKGAAQIGWGSHGDFARCQAFARRHGIPGHMIDGFCANLHKLATGEWPGVNAHKGAHALQYLIAAMPAGFKGRRWSGPLAPIGVKTGDGRIFPEKTMKYQTFPMPFGFQEQSGRGHDGAVTVGVIEHAEERMHNGKPIIWGRGYLLDPDIIPDVRKAEHLIEHGIAGASVDLDSYTAALRPDVDGKPLQALKEGRMRSATIVRIPAFADLRLQFDDDENEEPKALKASVDAVEDFSVNSSGWKGAPVAPREAEFDADDAVSRIEAWANNDPGQMAKLFLWVNTENEPLLGREGYRLPWGDIIDGKPYLIYHAIYAAAALLSGAHGGLPNIPDTDKARLRGVITQIYAHLATELNDPNIRAPWDRRPDNEQVTEAALVAAMAAVVEEFRDSRGGHRQPRVPGVPAARRSKTIDNPHGGEFEDVPGRGPHGQVKVGGKWVYPDKGAKNPEASARENARQAAKKTGKTTVAKKAAPAKKTAPAKKSPAKKVAPAKAVEKPEPKKAPAKKAAAPAKKAPETGGADREKLVQRRKELKQNEAMLAESSNKGLAKTKRHRELLDERKQLLADIDELETRVGKKATPAKAAAPEKKTPAKKAAEKPEPEKAPTQSAAEKRLARLEKERETLKGRLGMAEDRRRARKERTQSSQETKIRAQIRDKDIEINKARRDLEGTPEAKAPESDEPKMTDAEKKAIRREVLGKMVKGNLSKEQSAAWDKLSDEQKDSVIDQAVEALREQDKNPGGRIAVVDKKTGKEVGGKTTVVKKAHKVTPAQQRALDALEKDPDAKIHPATRKVLEREGLIKAKGEGDKKPTPEQRAEMDKVKEARGYKSSEDQIKELESLDPDQVDAYLKGLDKRQLENLHVTMFRTYGGRSGNDASRSYYEGQIKEGIASRRKAPEAEAKGKTVVAKKGQAVSPAQQRTLEAMHARGGEVPDLARVGGGIDMRSMESLKDRGLVEYEPPSEKDQDNGEAGKWRLTAEGRKHLGVESKTPETRGKKETTPAKATSSTDQHVKFLADVKNRTEALKYLEEQKLTNAQLKEIAQKQGYKVPSNATKAQLHMLVTGAAFQRGYRDTVRTTLDTPASKKLTGDKHVAALKDMKSRAEVDDYLKGLNGDDLRETLKAQDRKPEGRTLAALRAQIGDDWAMGKKLVEAEGGKKHPATAKGVRDAFGDIKKERGEDTEWVSIADVRDRMGGTRAEQDKALREFEQESDTNIVPQANQKVLSERSREGAVRIGGQDKTHLTVIPEEKEESRDDREARTRKTLEEDKKRLLERPGAKEDAVEQALGYLADAPGGKKRRVGLDELRERMAASGITDRADQDAVLKKMDRDGKLFLEPDLRRGDLPKEKQDAALDLGGKAQHWVSPGKRPADVTPLKKGDQESVEKTGKTVAQRQIEQGRLTPDEEKVRKLDAQLTGEKMDRDAKRQQLSRVEAKIADNESNGRDSGSRHEDLLDDRESLRQDIDELDARIDRLTKDRNDTEHGTGPKKSTARTVVAKKTAAPLKPSPQRQERAKTARTLLDRAKTREEAARGIDSLRLTIPQMRELAQDLDLTVPAKANKTQIRDTIVGLTAGRRLDSQALFPPGKAEGPAAPARATSGTARGTATVVAKGRARPESKRSTYKQRIVEADQESGGRVISGKVGQDWQQAVGPRDRHPLGVRVQDMTLPNGYTVSSGRMIRRNGTVYLIEDQPGQEADKVVDFLDRVQDSLPNGRVLQHALAWVKGKNPDDAYWAERFGTDHVSAATAGGGKVTVWGPGTRHSEGSVEFILRHEYGHNVDGRGEAMLKGIRSDGPQWTAAIESDSKVKEPPSFVPDFIGGEEVTKDHSHGGEVPKGVTPYGRSSHLEDFAESVMMYFQDTVGQIRMFGGPHDLGRRIADVFFRDLFPARAKLLDLIFPDVAKIQLERARRRGPLP